MQRHGKVAPPPPGDRPLKTLDRVLSKAGIGSRRDASELIRSGRVAVNGRVVRNPDEWIDLQKDAVMLDRLPIQNAIRTYWMLNKPAGYLTTYRHPHGRATVYDLLPEHVGWVFPVGRLDLDTSGLLLMTNDSSFAEKIMNPEFHVPKTYRVIAEGRLGQEQLRTLEQGVELQDGSTRPALVSVVGEREELTTLDLTITEGRNRQVRRMIEAVGSGVLELERIAVGSLSLGGLERGAVRPLEEREVLQLLEAATSGGR